MVETMSWKNNVLRLLDQSKLPAEVVELSCITYQDVADAIRTMKVRGAPAIGAAAAFGMVLGANNFTGENKDNFFSFMSQVAVTLKSTRPTAVNLFWAVERMENCLSKNKKEPLNSILNVLEKEATEIFHEDKELNLSIGYHGNKIVPYKATILTHCNAGSLATAGYGTALGVIRAAQEAGKHISVYADETRPLLQGARLTAWELMSEGIPVTLITDSMAGYVMKLGKIDMVIVGADRIAANGDVANKIGTYSLAVLAKEHKIPFYVAAPYSTIDLTLKDGEQIVIEERSHDEIRRVGTIMVAPEKVPVFNPAFDVTPHSMITAIITDKGVIRPPFYSGLKKMEIKEGESIE